MPSATEGLTGGKSELASDLAAGVGAIASNQTIKFTKYIRLVLPLDGYVFWVKADVVSKGALLNAGLLNAFALNETLKEVTPASTMDVQGSLHYATDNKQQADSSYAVNRIVFTSLKLINDFNEVGPNVLWIGCFQGLKFAFSSRKSFYQQAGLHHYVGDAVYPIMESQLVDSLDGFSAKLIVSNSLPIWLSMTNWAQQEWEPFGNPISMFPGYLVKGNILPPFAAVDVTSTSPLVSAAGLGPRLSHDQQARDRVKVTLWGLDNDRAMDFVDFVVQFSLNTNLIGFANSPIVRDDSRVIQVELGTIAKKKVIEYEVNYHQRSVRDVARQLILKAIPSFQYFN